MLAFVQRQIKYIKANTLIIYFAARDPQMPLLVKLLALMVAAYALSPVDLIPDFIPIIGLLDDAILVPLGFLLVLRLTPPEVLVAAKEKCQTAQKQPVSYGAAIFIVVVWLGCLWVLLEWLKG